MNRLASRGRKPTLLAHARIGRTRVQKRPSQMPELSEASVIPLLVNPIEGRSGTTLMMRILDAPEIVFDRVHPFEHRYLAYLLHLSSHMNEPFDLDPEWDMAHLLEGDPSKFGSIPFRPQSLDPHDWQTRLVRLGMMALSESFISYARHPVQYYAEKTWGNAIDRLCEAGVRSKIINLVRDPRDVIASIKAMDNKRGFHGFGRTANMTDSAYLQFLLSSMTQNLAKMSRAQAACDCRLVRYEDMVTDPSGVAAFLGEWLGVHLSAGRSLFTGRTFRRHTTSQNVETSIGRWQIDLTASEARIIIEWLGHDMQRLGYSLDN